MLLIRTHQRARTNGADATTLNHSAPPTDHAESSLAPTVSTLKHTVRSWHAESRGQRAIARDLNLDRRKVKQIVDRDTL